MKTNLEHKIDIAAKPAHVWNILMSFEEYPQWNPMVVQISGQPIVGSRINISVKVGDRKPLSVKPLVLVNETEKELRWAGTWVLNCLVRGEHYFRIEETPTGCTFFHGEDFSGIMVGVVMRMMGPDLENAYKAYDEAIKQRAENMARN